MNAIEISPSEKLGAKEILNGMPQLTTLELENIYRKAGSLLTVRKAQSMPARERFLATKIRAPFFNDEIQARFQALQEKSETGEWSGKECQEYKQMLKVAEAKSLERLACLVELSQLRGVSLAQTMKQFGLNAIHPANG